MKYSVTNLVLLGAAVLGAPLNPRQNIVTVTMTVFGSGEDRYHRQGAHHQGGKTPILLFPPSSGSQVQATPIVSANPSGSQQAASNPLSTTTATKGSPSPSSGSQGPSSAPGSESPPDDGPASVFPSNSPVPLPAAGVTVYASPKLAITPSVGPDGSPAAPSPTTQTYVDRCKTPSAPLPPLATPTDDSLSGWFLYYHNIHRRNHSAPDMSWSMELEKDAAILFGEYVTEGKSGHIMNINGDTYGQNLASGQFWFFGSGATKYSQYVVSNEQAANASTSMWYHEGDNLSAATWAQIQAFTFSDHFTQMISKHSTLLGCAVEQKGYTSAKEYSNGYSVACNYGNNNLKDTPVTPGLCQPQIN